MKRHISELASMMSIRENIGLFGSLIVITLALADQASSHGGGALGSRHMITSVGTYALEQSVQQTRGLIELSPTEYAAFRLGHPGPAIPQERIFHASPVSFEGAKWQVLVATTKEKIYKIALQYTASDPNSADGMFRRMKHYLIVSIGQISESSRTPTQYVIWDANEGNVVLDRADLISGEAVVDLYLTSKIIAEP